MAIFLLQCPGVFTIMDGFDIARIVGKYIHHMVASQEMVGTSTTLWVDTSIFLN